MAVGRLVGYSLTDRCCVCISRGILRISRRQDQPLRAKVFSKPLLGQRPLWFQPLHFKDDPLSPEVRVRRFDCLGWFVFVCLEKREEQEGHTQERSATDAPWWITLINSEATGADIFAVNLRGVDLESVCTRERKIF